MLVNEIDKFRSDFFNKLIKEEKEKERAKILEQRRCPHKYDIQGNILENGYQERTCSKCGHSALKSVRVWEGSKNGNCTIT